MAIEIPIHPRTGKPIKERLGIFGPPKVGKTHLFFTIAKWHQDLGSDAKFFAVSSDFSYEVLSMNPEFAHLTNMEWTDVQTMQDYVTAAKGYSERMRIQDWLSMDLQSDAWPAAQDEYARVQTKLAGGNLEDMGDLWATAGKVDEYPISGWEWQMPNARYRILAQNILLRVPGQLFCVYGQQALKDDSSSGKSGETVKTKEMFGHLGVKPNGQKDDPWRWHTLLHVDSRGKEDQVMATAGDRWGGREWFGKKMSNGSTKDAPMTDFFLDYLVNIAGWKM